jgi:hypothetical protein
MTSEVMASSDARCDESKCVSYLFTDASRYSFTCYSDNLLYPMQCAHGYTPRIVDAEPNLTLPVPYQYYTCCPPDLPPNNFTLSRHCSNSSSIFINDADIVEETDILHNSTIICEDKTRPNPRKMTNIGQLESFVCCDSIIEPMNNKTINFVDGIECVPFSDENYLSSSEGISMVSSIR